jgi:chromosomal replication initiation ATPase DnaA
MTNQVEILEFFREVQRVITKHGLQKVLTQLRRIQNDFDNTFEKEIFNFILNETAIHYQIEINDILNSKKRGMISEARRMSFALMKEHLPFTDEEIGYYFGGRSRQYVNKELTSLPINQEKVATKQQARFVDDFLMLTISVVKFKNEYNLINKIVE